MKPLLLIALLITIIGLALYFYLNPQSLEEIQQRSHEISDSISGTEPKTAHIYKWRNSAGEWQITDFPPPEGIPYESKNYRSDENVLPLPPQLTQE